MKNALLALLLFSSMSVASWTVLTTDFSPLLDKAGTLVGSVFFADSVTEKSLKKTYAEATTETKKKHADAKIRILIVPGHDAEFSGTAYRGVSEHTLTVELGGYLFGLLKKEPSFEVTLSQTKEGYDPVFTSYFADKRAHILAFVARQKGLMEHFVSTGEIERVVNVEHNAAPSEAALRLYGINRWANQNDMDIVIHIHFNDYPGRKNNTPGKYSGFAIYIPERQYSNAKGSKSVARSIHRRVATLYPQSDLPKENAGLVEDQELIALGSNNTLDGAGMLIEYGYIYEPAFADPDMRTIVLEDLALQTYLGVMDFFEEKETNADGQYQTRLVPYAWGRDLEEGADAKRDIVSLQAALTLAGVYPPPGKSKNDCGLTGFFGPCTAESVRMFQQKYGIAPAEGFVGEKTRLKLRELYE